MDGALISTDGWPDVLAASASPTTLLVRVALGLLWLHLRPHGMNLLSLNS